MPRFLRDRRDALEIDQLEQRIGRRLDPDQARVRAGSPLRARSASVRSSIGDLEPRRALAHALEQAARAAIEIVDRDDVRAVIEAFERGRDRGQAGREGEGRAAAFEIGDAALERHARRILACGRSRSPCARPGSAARRSRWCRSASSPRRWSDRAPGRRGRSGWRSRAGSFASLRPQLPCHSRRRGPAHRGHDRVRVIRK